MMRMVILAEVAVRTDDRNLLQQMAIDARDAYPTGSSCCTSGSGARARAGGVAARRRP